MGTYFELRPGEFGLQTLARILSLSHSLSLVLGAFLRSALHLATSWLPPATTALRIGVQETETARRTHSHTRTHENGLRQNSLLRGNRNARELKQSY